MTLKNRFLLGLLSFLLVLSWSCSQDPDCDNERPYNQVRIAFYEYNQEEEGQAVKVDTTFRVITAVWGDSVYVLLEDTTNSAFNLDLNPYSDTTLFVFESLRGDEDTLEVSYQRELEWLNEECGPRHKFESLDVAHFGTAFDSIRLTTPELFNTRDNSNASIENIRVLYID